MKTYSYIKSSIFVMTVFFLVFMISLLNSNLGGIVRVEAISSSENFSNEDSFEVKEYTAIIIPKSASGKSYMADRQDIITMPELKTQEEINNFILSYEPLSSDLQRVRYLFEELGFNIIAQDNLFLVVSGTSEEFHSIVPSLTTEQLESKDPNLNTFYHYQLSSSNNINNILDGVIIITEKNHLDDLTRSYFLQLSPEQICSIDSYQASYSDVQRALKLDRVHAQGYTGKGVKIGFIDSGVYGSHPFFVNHPGNFHYFQISHLIYEVSSNYDYSSRHGTAVASYLVNSAPDAIFYSMALTSGWGTISKEAQILSYLAYINETHLIDILNLSQAIWEEIPGIDEYLAELRIEFLNFINQNGLLFVGGGNAHQCSSGYPEYCSGHNAVAAIPEVIAVGGSELVPVGNSFIFHASSGAASFSSIKFPGRHVPDIVGVYGPIQVPLLNGSFDYEGGTSLASPQIAGMVALLKGVNPALSQIQAKEILMSNSFDITSGKSGDGDTAHPSYDLATGYGQPLATWIIQHDKPLYAGWNLIGITNDNNYTAELILRSIIDQGINCEALSKWDPDLQRYETIVIKNGRTYGSDFVIHPEDGFWVQCEETGSWREPGNMPVDSVIPVSLHNGYTLISLPYSHNACTAQELLEETNGNCINVAAYDGRFSVYQERNGIKYGKDFYLNPGLGYFVRCNNNVNWIPDCSDSGLNSNIEENSEVSNIFTPISIDDYASLDTFQENTKIDPNTDLTNCSLWGTGTSNISGNTFSYSWSTADPCPGKLSVYKDGNIFTAYDDRGMRFEGTTHLITVRGLEPLTTYTYMVNSGSSWYGPYTVTTGEALDQPSTKYVAQGRLLKSNVQSLGERIVYANLYRDAIWSSRQAVLINSTDGGYKINLGNFRTQDNAAYFDPTSATKLVLTFQGGAGDVYSVYIDISLSSNPEVNVRDYLLSKVPDIPNLLQPFSMTTDDASPVFMLYANGEGSLQYRIEISSDNFDTISYVFDQRIDQNGWSRNSYPTGEVAIFEIPFDLERAKSYQWRAFSYQLSNQTWSRSSSIIGFSISPKNIYLPTIFK